MVHGSPRLVPPPQTPLRIASWLVRMQACRSASVKPSARVRVGARAGEAHQREVVVVRARAEVAALGEAGDEIVGERSERAGIRGRTGARGFQIGVLAALDQCELRAHVFGGFDPDANLAAVFVPIDGVARSGGEDRRHRHCRGEYRPASSSGLHGWLLPFVRASTRAAAVPPPSARRYGGPDRRRRRSFTVRGGQVWRLGYSDRTHAAVDPYRLGH